MSTLDAFIDRCWNDHASDAAGVADRLHQALPLVADEGGVARLAMLVHHVCGEHLARWAPGLALLDQIDALRIEGEEGRRAVQRCRASLTLCAGHADARAALDASDACRVTAMAACSLAPHDAARAARHLEEAVAAAAVLADSDPGVRAVAAFGNNIAGTLQEQLAAEAAPVAPPSATAQAQRGLMLRAAEVARVHWARAGTWREVERAEYRLALCALAAGDAARALAHAQRCEQIVREHGSEPLEAFFAAEALALAGRALGEAAQVEQALASAEAAFATLAPDDQGWCLPTLEKLRAGAARPGG
jgi:hypothetical protein